MQGPLVGREDALSRLLQALAGTSVDGAVISGPPGMGKTRLLNHCLDELERRGCETVRLNATQESADLPLAALVPHLPPLSDADCGPYVQQAFNALRRLAEERLVLAVDDVHWLDPASLTVLQLLVDAGHAGLLVTARTDAVVPDAIERLCTAGRLERVELAALARQDLEDLLEAVLEGPVATTIRAELWRLTQGSPLLLYEALRGACNDGLLLQRGGVWLNHAPLANSSRLAALAHQAVAPLGEDHRHALELIAVAEPLELCLIEKLVSRTTLADLEERGLVALNADGQRAVVETAHPHHRNHVLKQLPVARSRAVGHTLAELLHATGLRREGDLVRWVTWQLQAGATVQPEQLLKATRYSVQAGFQEMAAILAPTVAKLDGFAAHLAAGEAFGIAGHHREAATALADAADLAGNEHQKALVAMARAQHLMLGQHRPQEALELLQQTAAACTKPHLQGGLAALEATFLSFAGDLEATLDVADRVLGQADAPPRAVLSVLTVSAFVRSMLGQPADALSDAARGEALLPELCGELPLAETQLGISRAYALLALGRIHEAEQLAGAAYQRELDRDAGHLTGSWATTYASILLERGKIETAGHVLSEAALLLETHDPLGLLAGCLALRAYASALTGDASRARRDLHLLDAQFGEHHRFMVWRGRARTWVAAAEGDHSRAQDHATETAHWAEGHQQKLWATWAYHDLVRLGAPERALEPLQVAANQLDTPAIARLVDHTHALHKDEPDGLLKVATAYARAGGTLYAAEAAGQAAAAYHRAGSRRSAARAATRMQQLLRDCPGAAMAGTTAPPADLTDREVEVARLAARGMTSQEVAQHLGVAVRTVDNHLHRTYRKLGIAGRDQLKGIV